MTDFRALCAELVEKLDELNCHYNVPSQSAMIERACAALADGPAVPDGREPASVTGQSRPVPVSERLPGPEDCDDQKRCWWLVHQSWPCLYLMKADSGLAAAVATHWLPAHALPVPGQEVR